MLVTPGISFLARGFAKSLLPLSLIVVSRHLFAVYFKVVIPFSSICISIIFLLPLVLFANAKITAFKHSHEAAAIGARMLPKIKGKWPGNIDALKSMLWYFHNGYPAEILLEYVGELGNTMNMRLLGEDVIFTVEPEHIKIVLATDFANYTKGEQFCYAANSVLGNGVFNSDGDMWRFHRSMTRPFFSREKISHFEIFDRHAEGIIKQIKSRIRAGHPVDFQDGVSRFTLDSATEFLFGSCVNSLSAGLPYPKNISLPPSVSTGHPAENFSRAFLRAQTIISHRIRVGWSWPLQEIWEDRTAEPMRIVESFLNPILKDAIEKSDAMKEKEDMEAKVEEEDDTLLGSLVRMTSDPALLKDQTLNILIAGRDTTASTLTFAIYALAMYPKIASHLREEILTHVGPARRPTYDDIRDMKYLRAFINETLRLFPPVPFDTRATVHATTWPSPDPNEKPLYIPAGASVPYCVFLMHRRTDLWGPDALEFDPDRFIDERLHKYLIPNPYIFLPFNAGPRICLGQQFAYNEISFMLIRILQNFTTFTLAPEAQPAGSLPPANWTQALGRQAVERTFPKLHLTMYAFGGLWVRMEEAELTDIA